MELREFESQLQSCVDNYLQLTQFLQINLSSELLIARQSLLSALFSINSCLYPSPSSLSSSLSSSHSAHSLNDKDSREENEQKKGQRVKRSVGSYHVGAICYAPRRSEGTIDVALITALLDGDMCLISWIYPRNLYELFSEGIKVDRDQLFSYSEKDHEERIHHLNTLSPGSRVRFLNDSGIFIIGELRKRMTRALSLTEEKLLDIFTENPSTSQISNHTLVEDILSVIPERDCPIGENQNEESNEETDEDEDLIESFSVSQEYFEKGLDGLKQLQDKDYLLGDWERHTRGVGSKLLEKMGYIRLYFDLLLGITSCRGCGLGKNSQGRVEPVDGMKVIPAVHFIVVFSHDFRAFRWISSMKKWKNPQFQLLNRTKREESEGRENTRILLNQMQMKPRKRMSFTSSILPLELHT
jgi:hypothetical protein